MRLTVAVLAMLALALATGFLAGYWEAMCGDVPWNCQAPITGHLY